MSIPNQLHILLSFCCPFSHCVGGGLLDWHSLQSLTTNLMATLDMEDQSASRNTEFVLYQDVRFDNELILVDLSYSHLLMLHRHVPLALALS